METNKYTLPLLAKHYESKYSATRRSFLLRISAIVQENYETFRQYAYEEKMNILTAFEEAIYQKTIKDTNAMNIKQDFSNKQFNDMYNLLCFKFSSKLDKTLVDNPNFFKTYILKPDQIGELTTASFVDLFPSKYEKVLERLQAGREAHINIKTSSIYTCPKCKESKCIIKQMYTKAFDECQNISVTCINCSFVFGR